MDVPLEEVIPIMGIEEDMTSFVSLINSLECGGKFKQGPVVFIPPASYNPATIDISKVRKWYVRGRKQYLQKVADGYYKFSVQYKKEDDVIQPISTARRHKDMVQAGYFLEKGPQPRAFYGKSVQVYLKEFMKKVSAAGTGGETLIAEYAHDQVGTVFVEGGSPGAWTTENLKNMIRGVVQYYEYSVVGLASPMLYFGTWLSFFVPQLADKNTWTLSYLYWGDPKIWIFLEPKDQEPFEKATTKDLKKLIKALFGHACKAMFHHKGLMVSPQKIIANGFSLKYAMQTQGQFLIVPPSSYHFGFNIGKNISEECHFTTRSWLIPGLLHKECQMASQFMSLEMEFFVFTLMPEHYADYVNGSLKVQDPLGGHMVAIKKAKPVIIEDEANDSTVRPCGIYDFFLAKTEGGVEYVYVSLFRAKTWMLREEAEKLKWFKQGTAVKFPDFLFNMELETFEMFPKVAIVLRSYITGDPKDITLEYLQNAEVIYRPTNESQKVLEDPFDEASTFYNFVKCFKCNFKRSILDAKNPAENFYQHMRLCGPPNSFVCHFCKMFFMQPYEIADHINEAHAENLQDAEAGVLADNDEEANGGAYDDQIMFVVKTEDETPESDERDEAVTVQEYEELTPD